MKKKKATKKKATKKKATKKKATKKKATKKKATKKKEVFKISLLVKRKDINDKFFDLVSHYIKSKPNREGIFIKYGIGELSDQLEITKTTLVRYINSGGIKVTNDTLFINIERVWDRLRQTKEIERSTKIQSQSFYVHEKIPVGYEFKKVTKEFTIHNFTKDNFFKPDKVFSRKLKDEQYYYKAGLYIVFERYKKNGKRSMRYVIQNMPVSHYNFENYRKGHYEFFEVIKEHLIQHPSLKYFRFNYFDVQKIDITK